MALPSSMYKGLVNSPETTLTNNIGDRYSYLRA